MAVDTQNNQTTDEIQQTPQPPDHTDSEQQDQPSNEAPADEQPADSELNAENADTYDSNQPEPDLTEIECVPSASQPNDDPEHIERILNMKTPIIVRIAKKKMKIGEVMKLNIGTVIQFDQDAYQYIDLMVNNQIIGLGLPVKVGENFGLKITQLGDITHTIKSLGHAFDAETP